MDKSKILLVIALVSGLFASSMAYTFTRGKEQNSLRAESRTMQSVVVAKTDIQPGTMLNSQQLDIRTVPSEDKLTGSFSRIDEVEGRYAKEHILPQEQLLDARLIAKGEVYGLPVTIPEGKRAVTIACNEVIGVGGFIKPGDKVDVLGTFDGQTMGRTATLIVLEDIEVLAISQEMNKDDSKTAAISSSATLAVTLNQAKKLTLAEEKGKLRLILRPPNDPAKSGNPTALTTPDQLIAAGYDMTTVKDERQTETKSVSMNKPGPPITSKKQQGTSTAGLRSRKDEDLVVEVFRGPEREILSFPN